MTTERSDPGTPTCRCRTDLGMACGAGTRPVSTGCHLPCVRQDAVSLGTLGDDVAVTGHFVVAACRQIPLAADTNAIATP